MMPSFEAGNPFVENLQFMLKADYASSSGAVAFLPSGNISGTVENRTVEVVAPAGGNHAGRRYFRFSTGGSDYGRYLFSGTPLGLGDNSAVS